MYPNARNRIRPKLAISTPGDVYEQEADRAANAVAAGDFVQIGHLARGGVLNSLHRVVMRPEDLVDSALPAGVEEQEEVQRSAIGNTDGVTPAFEPALQRAVGSGGEEMLPPTRSLMESRFGWDFSSVRVHHDQQAGALSREVNARAFTIGSDIFFAQAEYQPGTREGQRLLAHELTHVVQQCSDRVSRQIQRQTQCNSYVGYDTSADLMTYNCAGLALRTYQRIPASALYDEINANFSSPETPAGGTCDPGHVKFWHWQYDLGFEDDQGNVVASSSPDFHIVAGRVDSSGSDPSDVYSKNGRRNVYGPGSGPSFRPPVRERATSDNPNETPMNTAQGAPIFKVRTNMTEDISCADCKT